MRPQRWLVVAVGTLVLGACEQDSVVMTGPVVEELWLGPDVVASGDDVGRLADLSSDPVLREASGGDHEAAAAIEEFAAGLLIDPAPSYRAFDLTLTSLYGTTWGSAAPELDSDAALRLGVLDLYRDHAALTLFGVDRAVLDPFTQPNGT